MRYSSVFLFGALLAAGTAAHAETLNFSFGDASSTYTGSGSLVTGKKLATGEYTISSLTGSVMTSAGPAVGIASLLTAGTFPTPTNGGSFPANDNVVFFFGTGNGYFSQAGVSFSLLDGTEINLFNSGSGPAIFALSAGGAITSQLTPTTIGTPAAVTPEPATWLLLATGLAGACFLRRTV